MDNKVFIHHIGRCGELSDEQVTKVNQMIDKASISNKVFDCLVVPRCSKQCSDCLFVQKTEQARRNGHMR